MEQTQKCYKFLLTHSLAPPPKLSVGFERLFPQKICLISTLRLRGRGVEIAKFLNFVNFRRVLIYFVWDCS